MMGRLCGRMRGMQEKGESGLSRQEASGGDGGDDGDSEPEMRAA